MVGKNILLVDDEKDFSDTLAGRLSTRGFHVVAVYDGTAAIEKVKGSSFDAVILDMVMPGLSGLETLKRILKIDPDLQVILLTAHGTVKAGVDAVKSGATDFLQKPANLDDLMEKLQDAAAKKMILVEKRTGEEIADILRRRGW
jgi:two-component system, OmpR family, response regulator